MNEEIDQLSQKLSEDLPQQKNNSDNPLKKRMFLKDQELEKIDQGLPSMQEKQEEAEKVKKIEQLFDNDDQWELNDQDFDKELEQESADPFSEKNSNEEKDIFSNPLDGRLEPDPFAEFGEDEFKNFPDEGEF